MEASRDSARQGTCCVTETRLIKRGLIQYSATLAASAFIITETSETPEARAVLYHLQDEDLCMDAVS